MHPDAQSLLDLMSAISEEAWAAAWMAGLEYDLWEAVQSGPRRYGRIMLHDGLLARLKDLSHECGGWIRFDEERGEVFVLLPQWRRMFASRTLR